MKVGIIVAIGCLFVSIAHASAFGEEIIGTWKPDFEPECDDQYNGEYLKTLHHFGPDGLWTERRIFFSKSNCAQSSILYDNLLVHEYRVEKGDLSLSPGFSYYYRPQASQVAALFNREKICGFSDWKTRDLRLCSKEPGWKIYRDPRKYWVKGDKLRLEQCDLKLGFCEKISFTRVADGYRPVRPRVQRRRSR